jgi:hypothetical protein
MEGGLARGSEVRLRPVVASPYALPVLGCGAVLPLVLGFVEWNYLLMGAGFLLVIEFGRVLALSRFGFTEAGPGGLATSLGARRIDLAWDEVERLRVVPTIFGAGVQAVRTHGSPVTLAVPRRGVAIRTDDLDGELERLREQAPEGVRPDVERESPFPGVLVQGFLLALFAGVGLYVIWWVLFRT